jgi:hypothetical protein
MYVAGIYVESDTLLELASRLRKGGRGDLADWFQIAHDRDIPALALSPSERDAIIDELEGTYDGLAQIRGQLAGDHRDRA